MTMFRLVRLSCLRSARLLAMVAGLAVLAVAAPASAQRPATVELAAADDYRESLFSYVEYMADASLAMTAEEALSATGFRRLTGNSFNLGPTAGRGWFRFRLHNPGSEDGTWRLDTHMLSLRDNQVYVVRDGAAPEKILDVKEHDPFDARPVSTRYLTVDIPLAASETVDVLATNRTGYSQWMPLSITTPETYRHYVVAVDQRNFAIYGALGVLIALMLAAAPVLGFRLALLGATSLAIVLLMLAHASNYTFMRLWPDNPEWNLPVWCFTALMAPIGSCFVAREFLRTDIHFPRLDVWLYAFCVLVAGIALVSVLAPLQRVYATIASITGPIAVGSVLIICILGVRRGLPGAWPFLISNSLIFLNLGEYVLIYYLPVGNDLYMEGLLLHVTALATACCLLVAIVMRLVDMQKERNRALADALAAARERLRLDQQLLESQKRYQHVRELATLRQKQLADIGHDLRQPLVSLRAALDRLGGRDEHASAQMHAAFDYLESLARSHADGKTDADDPAFASGPTSGPVSGPASGEEEFELRSVLDIVYEMFVNEAAAAGVNLRYAPSSVRVTADPVALMRLVSNLVANAIRHASSDRVLLGARRRAGRIEVQVLDRGVGMEAGALQAAMKPGIKRGQSRGQGLGLAIAARLASEIGGGLDIRSQAGRGTLAGFSLAAAGGQN